MRLGGLSIRGRGPDARVQRGSGGGRGRSVSVRCNFTAPEARRGADRRLGAEQRRRGLVHSSGIHREEHKPPAASSKFPGHGSRRPNVKLPVSYANSPDLITFRPNEQREAVKTLIVGDRSQAADGKPVSATVRFYSPRRAVGIDANVEDAAWTLNSPTSFFCRPKPQSCLVEGEITWHGKQPQAFVEVSAVLRLGGTIVAAGYSNDVGYQFRFPPGKSVLFSNGAVAGLNDAQRELPSSAFTITTTVTSVIAPSR